MLSRFYFTPPGEEKQLLCGFAPTFGQTRSGTGDAHASGHDLPLIRALDDSLVCCLQARLPAHPGTFPIPLVSGTRGIGICWIEIRRQKRGIPVALHRPDATGALVKPLRERLGDERPASMAPLGQFRQTCGDLVQGAARARPRCVSDVRSTSLGHEIPRSCRSASASLCRKASR